MLDWLYVYGMAWLGLWDAIVTFGVATDLRYVTVGLIVAAFNGWVAYSHRLRHPQRKRLVHIIETTIFITGGFFFWPLSLGIWCALGTVLVPILFVLTSMVLLLRLLIYHGKKASAKLKDRS